MICSFVHLLVSVCTYPLSQGGSASANSIAQASAQGGASADAAAQAIAQAFSSGGASASAAAKAVGQAYAQVGLADWRPVLKLHRVMCVARFAVLLAPQQISIKIVNSMCDFNVAGLRVQDSEQGIQ